MARYIQVLVFAIVLVSVAFYQNNYVQDRRTDGAFYDSGSDVVSQSRRRQFLDWKSEQQISDNGLDDKYVIRGSLTDTDDSVNNKSRNGYEVSSTFALRDFSACPEVKSYETTGCKPLTLYDQARPLTALASFPGSGNTWVRHLLQEVTGIATGSVYCSEMTKGQNFPAEGVANNSVIVVKTHNSDPGHRHLFDRAVVILRNPLDTMLSEFNRLRSSKTSHPREEVYSLYWPKFIHNLISGWKLFYSDWMKFQGPLHIVRYENLMKDMIGEVKKILHFLHVVVNDTGLACMVNNSEGHFHRKWRNVRFDTCTHLSKDDCKRYQQMGKDIDAIVRRTFE